MPNQLHTLFEVKKLTRIYISYLIILLIKYYYEHNFVMNVAINRRLYKQFLLGTGVFNAELGPLIDSSEVGIGEFEQIGM